MSALTLRRTGFAATLLTGLLLTGSAVHGVSGMDAELELAASASDRPVLVAGGYAPSARAGGCHGPHDDGRERDDRRLT
jgi:hypothetical protein